MDLNQLNNKLINRIKAVRKIQNLIDLLRLFFYGLGFSSILVILFAFIEIFAKGDSNFREFLFYGFIVTSAISMIAVLVKPLLAFISEKFNYDFNDFTLKIGRQFPEIKDNLLNVIQLAESTIGSKDLINSAFDYTYNKTKDLDFKKVLEFERLRVGCILSILILGITFILSSFLGSFSNSWNRIAHYEKSFLPPIPFSISIDNYHYNILKGSDLKLSIIGEGNELPETISFYLKEGMQDKFEKFSIRKDSGKTYNYNLKSLKNNIEFYAEAEYFTQITKTEKAAINVFEMPIIKSISGQLDQPRYTCLKNEKFDESNANLVALKGSIASYILETNKPLDSAYLFFKSAPNPLDTNPTKTNKINFNTRENFAEGKLRFKNTGSYYLKVFSNGLENISPVEYNIIALEDDYPTINLVQPRINVQLSTNAVLPIQVEISDDYGLGKLKLYYKLIYSPYTSPDQNYTSIDINYTKDGLSQKISYIWDLNQLGITPEDKYEFYLEVFDNDIVTGPKSSKTSPLTLRLPSIEEAFADAQREQDQIEKELNEVLKESEDLQIDMKELQQELRKDFKKKKSDWEDQKKAKDIVDKQKQLKEKAEQIQKQMEQASKNMQENNLLTPETMEKFQKLQKLLKEVQTDEMRMQAEKLQSELQKMSPEQMQKALEEQQLTQEQFSQQIERTMKMLQKMKAEQQMDRISKKAQEMKKQQDEISKELDKKNLSKEKKEELQRKQKALEEKMNDLQEEMKDLAKQIKEMGDEEVASEYEKAINELQPDQTKQNMQDAQAQMQKGENQKAQQKQKEASENLQDFAQQMQKMKQEMMQNQSEKMIKDMEKAISDLLDLSQNQESLKNQTKPLNNNSNLLPKIQNKQGDINQSLNQVAQNLSKLSEQSFELPQEMGQEIGKAMQQMQKAANQLSERNPKQSARNQESAMASINKSMMQGQGALAQMKAQAAQQGQGSSGGQGQGQKGQGQGNSPGGQNPGSNPGNSPMPSFSQEIQQAAAQQQILRESMARMMSGEGEGQGGKGQKDGKNKDAGQMGRLKEELGEAQRQIEGMAAKEERNGKDAEKVSKELKKASEELKEILRNLESGEVTPEMLKKQERIISRLLDAYNSENERDFEKKREAKTGKEYNLSSPADLLANEEAQRQMEEMLKQLKQGYTKDYELIIKKYFDKIKEEQKDM